VGFLEAMRSLETNVCGIVIATPSFSVSFEAMKFVSAFQSFCQRLGFFLMLLGGILLGDNAQAHPNHDAIAEADWNEETGSLEVALQVNAHELERAVSLEAGESLDLDSDEASVHLKKFIAGHVRCIKQDGEAVRMKWLGAEIKVRSAWLYFEFPLGDKTASQITDCSLANTLFFDQYEDQKNTIALRLKTEAARRFLRFSKDQPVVHVNATKSESVSASAQSTASQ
jgi:hypothetical protein